MRHLLKAEGYGVRLRPVEMEDAAFIVWLRHLDHAKGKVSDSAADVAAQEAWLAEYFQREQDYYFLVETGAGIPVGTIGLYHQIGASAEAGRLIVRPGVHAGVAAALLVTDLAFQRMNLSELRVTAVSTNQSILSIDEKFGFERTCLQAAALVIDGRSVDLVHLVLTPEAWSKNRPRIALVARRAETQIRRWEQAQLQTNASAGNF
jgi:RimJ/RimL family protein N-acetyltransferase